MLTATRREIEDVFIGLGFRVVEGPEIDLAYYNFDALNHDAHAPGAPAADTFYVADDVVLRTHTSPMQVRAMELQPPPLYIVVPGPRLPAATTTRTHTPQFHQVEGLAVDEDITLADLQGTLLAFARAIFGDDREVRLRPHFFPFTEPSVELDVSCFNCTAGLPARRLALPAVQGRRRWIEILGAGMVDPNVFGYVREYGYDPERHQGFAWGMGIERIAFLKHGVPDLRHVLRERPAVPGAIRMRLPLSLAAPTTSTRASRPQALADRLTMTGTEVERVLHARRHRAGALRRRPRADARAPSRRRPADRLHGRARRGRRGADRLRRARTSPPARPSPSPGPAR